MSNYRKILEKLTQPIMWSYGPAGWQKCPLYKGEKDHNNCSVCKGRKIINTATGKPPK